MTTEIIDQLRLIRAADPLDRRRRSRMRLVYPVRLRRPGSFVVAETKTVDISSDGFFCFTRQPFSPREALQCELLIPPDQSLHTGERDLVLPCYAEVVRVVPQADGHRFGVACRLVA